MSTANADPFEDRPKYFMLQIDVTKVEKEIDLHLALRNSNGLLPLECFTLIVLTAIALICTGPLLEEWGLFHAFNLSGVTYVSSAFSHTVRPLHLVPYAMQWILGGKHHLNGVALGTALLLVLRYLVARWAVGPYLSGYGRWVVATMAATLVPWDGAWLGRFASAQLAAVFFLLVLGTAVRLSRRWSIGNAAICMLSVLLMLLTYQGLFLCLAVLPLGLVLSHREIRTEQVESASPIFRVIAIYMAIGGGCVVYGLYWYAISHLFKGKFYEEGLAAGAGGATILGHIQAMFSTAYLRQSMELPLLAGVMGLLCWRVLDEIKERAYQRRLLGLMFLCVMLLPLLGLIYLSAVQLHDPERINYPLSMGMVLLTASLLIHFSGRQPKLVSAFNGSVIVLILLVTCGLKAATLRESVVLQKSVLSQAARLIATYKPRMLIVRDETGELGDVYTFYPPILTDALAVTGQENVVGMICTPMSVDRIHPVAMRFPIPTTPRCEDLPELKLRPSAGVLVTHWNDGTLAPEVGK